MILGVSKWLGEKIGIEEKYVRLLFFIAFLFYGVGLGFYIALWIYKLISKE
tara:strand:+ start:21090 stop:21242 length:153 start_codon:yes stop_codon:yes gene_type:complete